MLTLPKSLTILSIALTVAGCAVPGEEGWPKVSFGPEIQSINDARNSPSEISLSPLPTLTEEDRAGSENQQQFLSQIETDLTASIATLDERKAEYNVAKAGLDLVSGTIYRDTWLVAQMELSNISQATEAIRFIRARISVLDDPLPPSAQALLSRAEALELEHRIFVAGEKIYISTRAPS